MQKASPLATWIGSLLKGRYLPLVAALLAILLTLPALRNGWMIDDYYHRTVLLGTSQFRGLLGDPAEMFRFFRGDPARTSQLMDVGICPWWTDPALKAEFLQATTVLTHQLDYALWPDSPVLMHLHSLLWLGAAAAVVGIFYRRVLGATQVAGVAALLFALDDARGATVGFLANRNVLVAATFGVLALIAHDRWRRDNSRLAACLAPLLLMVGLFSKEEGVGICAYFGAYALFLDPRGWWRGCWALWPYVSASIVWAVLRASWGYGVRDMGLYIEPLTDPVRFLEGAVQRMPILLLGQWTPISADIAIAMRSTRFLAFWSVAVTVLGVLLYAMLPLLRCDKRARFFAVGMVLATVPVCATFPMDRLLTFASIGAFGLLSLYLEFIFSRGAITSDASTPTPKRKWRLASVLAWSLVVSHAVLAPIALPFRAANPLAPKWIEERLYVGAVPADRLAERTVVIVNAPSCMHAAYLVLRQELSGQPVPRHTRVLSPANPSVKIRRVDEHTLAISPQGGYLRLVLDQIFRSERRPLALGEQVRLSDLTITVTSLTADGRPAAAEFRFNQPLESPELLWLCFREGGFEPFTPPSIGQQTDIDMDWKALLSRSRAAQR